MKVFKKICLLLLIYGFSASSYSQSYSGPYIHFDSLTIDLGILRHSASQRKVTFVFTNLGDAPVMIENVESSCGCTKVTYPKRSVKPGKSGKINVEFDGGGISLGKFLSKINVFNNSPFRNIILRIRGEISEE